MSSDVAGAVPSRPLPAVRHTWIAGPADARRMAWPITLRMLLRVRVAVLVLIGSAAMGLLVSPAAAGYEAVALVLLLPLIGWLATYRRLRRTVRAGTRWLSGYDENAILIENPDATAIVEYHMVKRIAPHGSVVALQLRRSGPACYPAALFPSDAVAFIRAQLATAQVQRRR